MAVQGGGGPGGGAEPAPPAPPAAAAAAPAVIENTEVAVSWESLVAMGASIEDRVNSWVPGAETAVNRVRHEVTDLAVQVKSLEQRTGDAALAGAQQIDRVVTGVLQAQSFNTQIHTAIEKAFLELKGVQEQQGTETRATLDKVVKDAQEEFIRMQSEGNTLKSQMETLVLEARTNLANTAHSPIRGARDWKPR